eukprot:COSAG01_NODE_20_length_38868_cov_34.606071_18_plen_71_part_00
MTHDSAVRLGCMAAQRCWAVSLLLLLLPAGPWAPARQPAVGLVPAGCLGVAAVNVGVPTSSPQSLPVCGA